MSTRSQPSGLDRAAELALAVRQFLLPHDLMTRLSTPAKLYLEFSDIMAMHRAHLLIEQEVRDSRYRPAAGQPLYRYVDDHTIVLDVYAGIEIVLTCAQRFAVSTGGSIAYRDILFVDKPSE